MNLYLGTPGKTAADGGANPYRYGLATEVKLSPKGSPKVVKHYAMGRLSNELAHILPDGRTAYKGDDGRDTGTDGTNSGKLEYLKLRPGMGQAAAFLETRRYAAVLGATTEFTKMEGETSSTKDRKLYLAMSYIERGMLGGKNEDRPRDDIALAGDPSDLQCGAVYESNLRSGQKDTSGKPIKSNWVVVDMHALVLGAKKPAGQNIYGRYDRCDTDKLANPDNIKFSEAMRTLFIGEDSGNHMNNFLWAYNVDSKKLTRIASGRIGAEWTGLQIVPTLGGHAYIMANQQHPGAAEDTHYYRKPLQGDGIDLDAILKAVDQRGAVGYLGGLPGISSAH